MSGPAGGGGFNPFSMFKGNQNPPAPNAAGNQTGEPGAPAANGQPAVPGSGGMPNQPNVNADPNNKVNNPNDPANKGAGTGSPLDTFTDLFKVDPNKQAPKDPLAEPLFNLDPKKLSEAATKMDFTRNLNPELVQKALQGDVGAFSQTLNQAFQSSFMMTMQMVTGMMEGGVKRNNERFNSVLGERFRNFQIDHSTSKNPALNHPAAKPVISSLKQLIASQNPQLSPEEVTSQAEEYFLSMGKAISSFGPDGKPIDVTKTGGNSGGEKQPDYSAFLNLG